MEAARPSLVPVGAGPSAEVRLSVDPTWLHSLPAEAFPVSLDPSLWIAVRSDRGYKSDGYSCVCWMREGNSRDNGDRYWRTVAYFPYESLYGKRITDALLQVWDRAAGTPNGYPFHVFHATGWGFNNVGAYLGGTTAFNDAAVRSAEMTAAYDSWATQGLGGALMIVGHEAAGLYTYKQFNSYSLTLTYDNMASVATPVAPSPANGSSIHSLTPTLAASATDADGDPLYYFFRVTTGPNETGALVWEYGWSPASSVSVPANVLAMGQTYHWHAYVHDTWFITSPNYSWSFTHRQRTTNCARPGRPGGRGHAVDHWHRLLGHPGQPGRCRRGPRQVPVPGGPRADGHHRSPGHLPLARQRLVEPPAGDVRRWRFLLLRGAHPGLVGGDLGMERVQRLQDRLPPG